MIQIFNPIHGNFSIAGRDKVRQLILRPDITGTALLTWCVDRYGAEKIIGEDPWVPEMIRHELEYELSLQMPDRTFDRLMAAIVIVTTDLFFESVERFIPLARTLSGDLMEIDDDVWMDPVDAAVAMTEAKILDPQSEPCNDIRIYLGLILSEYGMTAVPPPLREAILPRADDLMQWTDSPDMFLAAASRQESLHQEIIRIAKEHRNRIFSQIKELPLVTGKFDLSKLTRH